MNHRDSESARCNRNLVSHITRLGAVVCQILRCIPRGLKTFATDFLHGCSRILRWLGRLLRQPIRPHWQLARQIERNRQTAKGLSRKEQAKLFGKSVFTLLLSENGIFVSFFRIGVPILFCAFFCTIVAYGTRMDYSIAVRYNGELLGYISNEADYLAAERLVQERLSHADADIQWEFTRNLQLEPTPDGMTYLSVGTLADKMLQSAEISLTSGYGVFINNTYMGVVEDKTVIEEALAERLRSYQDALPFAIESVSYADEIRYESGTWLTESLVDAQALADQLTGYVEGTTTYTVQESDTIHTIAARHTMSVDELRALNPETADLPDAGTELTVPSLQSYLPIRYTLIEESTSFIDYDTVRVETASLPIGKEKLLSAGVRGEKRNTVEVAYIDGVESSRTILNSELISEPVDAQLGVGTYAAKPDSTATRLYGTGDYNWPVDGGYVSDPFLSDRNHSGMDIAAPAGTDIFAAADGEVITAGWHNGGYGYYIVIDHGDGRETLYAHCSVLLVGKGEKVSRGQHIAEVGSTGRSTGNHLHFEVHVNGTRFDPATFIRVNAE